MGPSLNMNKKLLMAAALAGVMAASQSPAEDKKPESKSVMGECHGINSCKGTGDCGGKDTSCAGTNSCKGKGWKKMTQEDCKTAKGKFKADAQ